MNHVVANLPDDGVGRVDGSHERLDSGLSG
jgi:hypothetical protein